MSTAEELKQLGNKAFSAGDHDTAIKYFTDAIALDPSNHVLYSNRSASHCSLKNFEKALEDAEKCVSIKPDWSKGHGRKGAALFGLKKYQEAKNAYMEGLKIDPDNEQLKKGLSDVHEVGGAEGMNAMFKVFNDPKAIEKLTLNPKTRAFMAQPDFMTKLRAIQANPQSLQAHLSDPRIMQALGVLLGVDLTASEGFGEEPMEEENAFAQEPKKEEPRREEPKKEEPKKEEPKKEEPKKEEPKKEEDTNTEDSDLPRVTPENKKRASEEKELGNQLYKKKSFQEALQHYQKAWELDPSSIVYLNNMAAVYFEMGNYDECISTCTKAVEEGRNIRADYQLIAKAFGRAGNAYFKKDDMDNAILYFGKSLTEHRTPDILAKLREAEKLRDVRAKEAYINPALAVEAREKGNALFKEQNYSEAVKFYTEATKRDPKDAKNYSNRAAAYNKLMALPEALRDCEEAIRLDPEFVRAHLRKASVLVAMKKFGEALTALEAAKGLDKEGAHSSEVMELEMKCYAGAGSMSEAEVAENARKDPEVAQILSDPVMRSILEQMQSNPKALSEHMKNPAVAKKIQKLMDAGIIRVGR